MEEMYKVVVRGEEKEVPAGTTFEELAAPYQSEVETIILAQMDNKLYELQKELPKGGEVTFLNTTSKIGSQTYKRSVTLLLLKAIYDVYGREKINEVKVLFSVGSGYYCTVSGDVQMDETFLTSVKARMQELVEANLPIKKQTINTDEAIERFHQYGMYDKERLFHYRRASKVNIYSIGNFEDYYYGYMASNTGILKYFDLFLYYDGLVLELP